MEETDYAHTLFALYSLYLIKRHLPLEHAIPILHLSNIVESSLFGLIASPIHFVLA